VGQWHSHHKINLFKPSVGDENTVWSNMPNLGLDRYIVFIANIPNEVTINSFLFQIKKGKQLSVKHGEFEFLDGNSPLRLNENVLQNVHSGAESFNQITRFEKEIKYMRNKDEIEILDISNKNEREKTKNRYTQENTGTTEKQDKNKPKQKLSVSVYHIPTPERPSLRQPGFTDNYTGVARIVKDTHKQWEHSATTPTTSDQGSKSYNYPTTPREKQKQRDLKETTPKSSESDKLASTSQKERQRHVDKDGNKERHPNTRRTTEGAEQLQSPNIKFKGTDSRAMNVIVYQPGDSGGHRTHKQWEYSTTTPTTGDQGSKSYNLPTTPKGKQKQRDLKETTPKSSESGKLANASQKERERHVDKVGNKHQYPNTRRTTEGAQQLQLPSVKFKGTDSQAMNVTVNQQRGFGGSGSLKKKSGDDDVKGDIELPQRKNSRPNSHCIPPSQHKPEVIHKRSSTPSGTFTLAE
jgi:hypothetical protein